MIKGTGYVLQLYSFHQQTQVCAGAALRSAEHAIAIGGDVHTEVIVVIGLQGTAKTVSVCVCVCGGGEEIGRRCYHREAKRVLSGSNEQTTRSAGENKRRPAQGGAGQGEGGAVPIDTTRLRPSFRRDTP